MAIFTYLVPLENVILSNIRYFKIDDVKITSLSNSLKSKLILKYKRVIKRSRMPQNFKDSYSETVEKLIRNLGVGAIVTVYEPDRSDIYERVLDKIQPAIDILNFYGSYIRGRSAPAIITIQGRFDNRRCNFFCLNQDSLLPGWKLIKDHPYIFHYELNRNTLNRMRRLGWERLIEMIKQKRKRDKYIIRAIRWFSQAMVEENNDIKLVKLFISLESLLIFGKEAKGPNLGERCALLIGRDYQDRLYIEDFIKECYRLRGDIIHEGKKDVSTNVLFHLEKNAFDVIIKILKNNTLNSKNDLYLYLKRLKYDR